MPFRIAQLSVGQNGAGQDRALVISQLERMIFVVADGAGGSGRGGEAAEAILDSVRRRAENAMLDAALLLHDCDRDLSSRGRGGQSTAVVAIVDAHGIKGASVGDSEAWLVSSATQVALTSRQIRKPLIGSGEATPVSFNSEWHNEVLLLASDGLIKYGSASRIREIINSTEIEEAPLRLIDSVRLRSGALQDDATVVLCRR